jgi:hypothetical protein
MLPKPTREEVEPILRSLIKDLKDYYKILARDFNYAETDEDESWLDSEIKRTSDYLRGLDESALVELHAWDKTEGKVD